MTYTNEIPPHTTFAMIFPHVSAPMEMDQQYDQTAIMELDVEITLPSKLRPVFGFAGKTVPFKTLLGFLEDKGSPVSRDRDLTLRHQAAQWASQEDGTFYDHYMYADLPPHAVEGELSLRTEYVLRLVADDIADTDPENAAFFRNIADTYYAEPADDNPSEEEIQYALQVIEEMIGTYSAVEGDFGYTPVIVRTGPK